VPVYDLGLDYYKDIYFTMKRIEGEDLFKVIQRLANKDEATMAEFSLDRMLGALTQVINVLDYSHNHGVIHRDVKPENILVGTYGEVYLMDWGVALVTGMKSGGVVAEEDPEELFSRLTVTGKRPGTPLYMSPEQINGDTLDHRSDIFSMGVVLYEALTAREPFRGKTITETFHNIRNETPPPPSEAARYRPVPRDLDEICLKAMAKDPADRYQESIDLVRAIRHFRNEALTEASLD
jgi:serine/threonine-protein kinase